LPLNRSGTVCDLSHRFALVVCSAFLVSEDDEFEDKKFEERRMLDLVDLVPADDGLHNFLGEGYLFLDVHGFETFEGEPD
jgi:hypothetical protein